MVIECDEFDQFKLDGERNIIPYSKYFFGEEKCIICWEKNNFVTISSCNHNLCQTCCFQITQCPLCKCAIKNCPRKKIEDSALIFPIFNFFNLSKNNIVIGYINGNNIFPLIDITVDVVEQDRAKYKIVSLENYKFEISYFSIDEFKKIVCYILADSKLFIDIFFGKSFCIIFDDRLIYSEKMCKSTKNFTYGAVEVGKINKLLFSKITDAFLKCLEPFILKDKKIENLFSKENFEKNLEDYKRNLEVTALWKEYYLLELDIQKDQRTFSSFSNEIVRKKEALQDMELRVELLKEQINNDLFEKFKNDEIVNKKKDQLKIIDKRIKLHYRLTEPYPKAKRQMSNEEFGISKKIK